MFSSLKLGQKAYLLVGIPLVFELVFIAVLFGLLQETEAEVQKATESRKVISKLNRIYINIFEGVFHARSSSLYTVRLRETKELIDRTNKNLDDLEDLSLDRPEDLKSVRKLKKNIQEGMLTAFEARKVQHHGDWVTGRTKAIMLKPHLESMKHTLLTMLEEHRKIEARGLASAHARRDRITQILLGGIVLNIGVALLVVSLFNRSVSRRLSHLIENTRKLSRQETLNLPIEGSDEIAHLDSVFYDVGEKLLTTTERQRAIFNDIADVICSISEDGEFIEVSPTALRAWGYSQEELTGLSLFELVVASELSKTKEAFESLKKSDVRSTFECQMRTKEGPIINVLWSNRWSSEKKEYFCVVHDITQRKQNEELLADTEAKLRAIIESMPIGLFMVNTSGLVKMVNPTAQEMFELGKKDVFDKPFADFIKETGTSELENLLSIAESSAKEVTAIKAQGEEFPCEISASTISSPDGLRKVILVLDVSERHEVERMKQQFIAVVSHELKTPISSVQIYLDVLNDGKYGELNEKGKASLAKVSKNVERLTKLIEDLLVVERLESGAMTLKPELIEVQDFIDMAVESVRAKVSEKSIKLEFPEVDHKINGDLNRLVQVLVNLLSNAIKFSDNDSKIEITVKKSSSSLMISVVDQGRGIPLDKQSTIFEKYKQVSENDAIHHGGAGLGLAICKEIIELHGGTIGVESKEGSGSWFWFRLPIS